MAAHCLAIQDVLFCPSRVPVPWSFFKRSIKSKMRTGVTGPEVVEEEVDWRLCPSSPRTKHDDKPLRSVVISHLLQRRPSHMRAPDIVSRNRPPKGLLFVRLRM
jgi:hypothetical protein